MCLSLEGEETPIISIDEITDKGKYDPLRSFYTRWNQIINPRPRVIFDTHAGSGIVNLKQKIKISKQNITRRIYGSPLIAIIKTLKLSNNLKIILNEIQPDRFKELERIVDNFVKNGVPVFQEQIEKFKYRALDTQRKNTKKIKPDIKFLDSPDQKLPRGYSKIKIHSKADIILYNKPIEKIIDVVISEYLGEIVIKNKMIKPVVLFFVDPCGIVDWNSIIQKICDCSRKEQGIELILNWSWEAILRNLNNKYKNSVLSRIYGIPIEKVEEEFDGVETMNQFLEKYEQKLRKYFVYVGHLGIPRKRKIKPKRSEHRKYFLLSCSNNISGASLAGYSFKKTIEKLRDYKDIREFL